MSNTRDLHVFDQLPGFEGEKPVGTELALSGAVGRRTRAFRIGEAVVFVVEAQVTSVNHKEAKGGIVRAHAFKVTDAYELGDSRAPDLLEQLHEEYQAAEDEARGRAKLPFDGEGDEVPDAASAAAGAGPESRAEEREQAWAAFGGEDISDEDRRAAQELSDAADLAAIEGIMTREEFLAAVEQYAHDVETVPVDLGEKPPHADNVVDLPTGAAKPAKAATKATKATRKSPAPKR